MAMARSTIVGVFANRRDAERAVDELERLGFRDDQIGFLSRDGDRDHDGDDAGTGERAAKGAALGVGVGGLIGALMAMAIPGIGPAVAGGILATALTGAAVGGVTGSIAAALIRLDVPEEEASYYDSEFQAGRTLVTVRADARNMEAQEVLRRHGATDIERRSAA
jgi:hypothetical protein